MPNDPTSLAAAAAMTTFAVAAIAVVALHLIPSDTNPIADGTSAYALGPTARGYEIQAIASGLGGLLLAVALAERSASLLAVGCLVAYGLTRIAIVAYPTDPRGSTLTATGRVHALLATVAFLAAAVAAPVATATFDAPSGSSGTASAIIAALAILTTVTSVGSFVVAGSPRTIAYYGLAQRAFYASSFGWLIATSAAVAFG